jgi:hypothetical protein
MQLYAYIPRPDGSQPVGSDDQWIIRDLKTVKGAIKRIKCVPRWKNKPFRLYMYTNLYDDKTHTLVYINEVESRYTAMNLDREVNIPDLIRTAVNDKLVGIVDEKLGGIVAYVIKAHEQRLLESLNKKI